MSSPKHDSISIKLDKELGVYYPGDLIVGSVLLPFTSLAHIQTIDIELAVCSLVQLRPGDDSPVATSQKMVYSERKNLWAIHNYGKPVTRLDDGLIFPFEFLLPTHVISPDNTSQGSTAMDQHMPPTFVKEDGRHSARVEYGINATCAFVDPNSPLLQTLKTVRVKTNPRTKLELMRFIEMPSNTSIVLEKEVTGGFFKKAFSKKSPEDSSFKFRLVIIRPDFIRYSHRLFFKALLLTDSPPEFFQPKELEKYSNGSVRRGATFNKAPLYLRGLQASIIAFTHITADEYTASMYSEEDKIISSSMAIPLDLSRLVPFETVMLPASIETPSKYVFDFTNLIPPMQIPKLVPTFETENIKQIHLLKFNFKLCASQVGADNIQTTDCQHVINIVSPGMDVNGDTPQSSRKGSIFSYGDASGSQTASLTSESRKGSVVDTSKGGPVPVPESRTGSVVSGTLPSRIVNTQWQM